MRSSLLALLLVLGAGAARGDEPPPVKPRHVFGTLHGFPSMSDTTGQVIAGEIGSGPFGYTAVGEQVGIAQRIESVAPRGGVMLSESTARLVRDSAVLSDPQFVHVKGARDQVPARLLLGVHSRTAIDRRQSTFVGRSREIATLTGRLERTISGEGQVVVVVEQVVAGGDLEGAEVLRGFLCRPQ